MADKVSIRESDLKGDCSRLNRLIGTITDQVFTPVGTPGTYTKVKTDSSGRVVSGGSLGNDDMPAGVPVLSTRESVIGSRIVGTAYPNTSRHPIFVAIVLYYANSGGAQVFVGPTSSPSDLICQSEYSEGNISSVTFNFWVLPGEYYVLVLGGLVSVTMWWEYHIG